MTILVTGGTGYIGSHTVVLLLQAGHEVIIVDNLSNSKIEVLDRIHEIAGSLPSFYKIDLLDEIGLETVFNTHKIEAVIHFAGLKAVGESVAMPLAYYHNNLTGSFVLVKLMAKYGCKKLVFSSSATVYGDQNRAPMKETDTRSATNPYGATKLMLEQIFEDLGKSDSSWSIALLRYFNPIGAHHSGLIGENPNGIPNNLLPYVAKVAKGDLPVLQVYGKDYDTFDGTGVRDYIHVVDLAHGHLKALDHVIKHSGVEAFNLGTGTGYSVLQVIEAFEKATGQQVPYKIVNRRPGDIGSCFAQVSKAEMILGWKANKDLITMCQDHWRFASGGFV